MPPAALGIGLGVLVAAVVAGGFVLARADDAGSPHRATTVRSPSASTPSVTTALPRGNPSTRHRTSASGGGAVTPTQLPSSPSLSVSARSVPANSVPSAPAPSAPEYWITALHELDAIRTQAFATRDPALLQRVYSTHALAEADAAQLRRLVPAGCGLPGVRTTFAHVTVRITGDRAVLRVSATLPPTQLICGTRARATLAGAGPTRLRLVLERTDVGARIAEQRLAG